uniref:DUF4178 domain-containing protein n=1 Tax=Parastrongyloides trichosuri TaxID=131310 RepID=A0A0N4ZHE0_PARTI
MSLNNSPSYSSSSSENSPKKNIVSTFSSFKEYINISFKDLPIHTIDKKSSTFGYVSEFDIFTGEGFVWDYGLHGDKYYVTSKTYLRDKEGNFILSLYPGEKVLFEYVNCDGTLYVTSIWSHDGNEEIRKEIEDKAWEYNFKKYGFCLWCGSFPGDDDNCC